MSGDTIYYKPGKVKTKNFSLESEHYEFFKKAIPGKAGSKFIQELINKSKEFKAWKKDQTRKENLVKEFSDI